MIEPVEDQTFDSNTITFRWDLPGGDCSDKPIVLRVANKRDVNAPGATIFNQTLDANATSFQYTFDEAKEGTELFWSVWRERTGTQAQASKLFRFTLTPPPTLPPETTCLKPLLRYWHEGKQKHFYTTNREELGSGADGWLYEGFVGYVAATPDCYAPNAQALYRYWSETKQKHFYTTNPDEAAQAVDYYAFVLEGAVGYVLPARANQYHTIPLYRLVKASTEDHFYTVSAAERDYAVNHAGYQYEGVSGYIFGSDAFFPMETTCIKPILRYWNDRTRKHFYTNNRAELGVVDKDGGWIYEGAVGYVATTPDCYVTGVTPMVRMWHPTRQKHFYTAFTSEATFAEQALGFQKEGNLGYLFSIANETYHTQPIYRLYKPTTDDHFYTNGAAERDAAVQIHGYQDEGIAGYSFTSAAITARPRPAPPYVQSNFVDGSPGSVFVISAGSLAADTPSTVSIKGPSDESFREITQLTNTANGTLSMLLSSLEITQPGVYTLRIEGQVPAMHLAQQIELDISLTIDEGKPTRTEYPNDLDIPVLTIEPAQDNPPEPDSIPVYLPLVQR